MEHYYYQSFVERMNDLAQRVMDLGQEMADHVAEARVDVPNKREEEIPSKRNF